MTRGGLYATRRPLGNLEEREQPSYATAKSAAGVAGMLGARDASSQADSPGAHEVAALLRRAALFRFGDLCILCP